MAKHYTSKDISIYLDLSYALKEDGEFSMTCESMRDAENRKHKFYWFRDWLAELAEENGDGFAFEDMLAVFQDTAVGIHTTSGRLPVLRFSSKAADMDVMAEALKNRHKAQPVADLDAMFEKMKKQREERGVEPPKPDANKGSSEGNSSNQDESNPR